MFSLGDTHLVDESMTLIPSADGVILSQGVFFVGYPRTDRVPVLVTLPFVKHGILYQHAMSNDVHVWWVDGMNNPGFPGGPWFQQGRRYRHDLARAGIVTGYITQEIAVAGGAGLVPANSGIIVVYDIKHATDAIDASSGKRAYPNNLTTLVLGGATGSGKNGGCCWQGGRTSAPARASGAAAATYARPSSM